MSAARLSTLGAVLAVAMPTYAADVKLADAQYPEGALWHRGRLYYAEMARGVVVVSDLRKTEVFWRMDECGPTSIAPYRADELDVLCHLAHKIVRVSLDGETRSVIERDGDDRPFIHPNAACADASGGVYVSSSGRFDPAAPAVGAVLYLDRAGKLARVAEDIHYANGVAFDAAGRRLLVSAHLARKVLAFPIRAPGQLGASTVFFDLSKVPPPRTVSYPLAGPDGLEVAPDRTVLVAEYGAGWIHKVGADGTWLGLQDGFPKFVTDMALLPGDRAAITAPRVNDAPPFPGEVLIRDRFMQRFVK